MVAQALQKLKTLLRGSIPTRIDSAAANSPDDRELAEALNQLIVCMEEIHQFIMPLAHGELSEIRLSPKNFLASPFKELHSRLSHLTWQTKQVANGDYGQRIDFMGEFSEAFNAMVVALERNERLLKQKIDELQQALSHIKRLEGILPICAHCKRIRLETGDSKKQKSWIKIESYLSTRTDAQFSHSICPECMQKYYPEYAPPEDDAT
jgi:soluble cytochrome b562